MACTCFNIPFETWNILDMELAMTNVDELGFSWVHLGLVKLRRA